MKAFLRAALITTAVLGAAAFVPSLSASERQGPSLVNVTIDLSPYIGRTIQLFAGRTGTYSAVPLGSGQRVVVPLGGRIEDLGTTFVRTSRLTVAIDGSIAAAGNVGVAAVPVSRIVRSGGGRTPVADLVAEIDQEPAPSAR